MTLDEILSEQIKRLPPNLRAELQTPRRDTSRSLLGGIGLSRMETPGTVAGPRRGYPRDFAGRATNVIVEGDQAAPSPAVLPQGMDENSLVRQAGFASANSELAPLLSDWRTTPIAALSAALGGYGRGAYGAQRDLAAGRAEAQKAERENAQAAAQDAYIAGLPPDKRFLAELDRKAFVESELKRQNAPPAERKVFGTDKSGYYTLDESGQPQRLVEGVTEEGKPIQVGNDLVDASGNLLYRAPFAPRQAGEPPVTYQALPPEQLQELGLPPGTQISSRGEYKFGPAQGGGGSDPELIKLQNVRDSLPEGDRRKAEIQAKIDSMLKGRGGIRLQNADGSVLEIGGEGGGGTMDLTQTNLNEAQRGVISGQDQLARIQGIGKDFKPEYQTIGPRVSAGLTAGMERLGIETSPQAQSELANLRMFQSSVANNLNQSIKEQSGLTMNESEAERLQKEVPSDSDSPTEFAAKLKANKQRLSAAVIRKKLLLQQGIQFDPKNPGIELDDVPNAVNQMGQRLERDLITQGMSPEQAAQEAAKRLKSTLGL